MSAAADGVVKALFSEIHPSVRLGGHLPLKGEEPSVITALTGFISTVLYATAIMRLPWPKHAMNVMFGFAEFIQKRLFKALKGRHP